MGIGRFLLFLVILGGALALLLPFIFPNTFGESSAVPEPSKDGWWGRGKRPQVVKDDPSIRNFKVKIDDSILDDLQERLNRTRFHEPLENAQFHYGFNSHELRKVVDYWKKDYDWRKQEKFLNKYDQFLTQIEGIDVHFIRVKPNVKPGTNKQVLAVPLLLIHGWPGSVVEFYKILPLLTEGNENAMAIEVICPSIPGYGFSEAPHQQGFAPVDAARVFDKLMVRLGYKQYYVQGGDWGSIISTIMAQLYPERVRGLMINLVPLLRVRGVVPTLKFAAGLLAPSLVFQPEEQDMLAPFSERLKFLLRESGYYHLQSTKPDTAGAGLTDSPAGLAAYILEKFSTWQDPEFIHKQDGGITTKFTMDELLTNVMVYWVTGSITSSMRFYKETILSDYQPERYTVQVPTGIAQFPKEIMRYPITLAKHSYLNIVRSSLMPRGGHFAAFEEPELLAKEIFAFIDEVEKREKSKATSKTS